MGFNTNEEVSPILDKPINIICRGHVDDFGAFRIAQGMTDCGADVFSITYSSKYEMFHIFAKAPLGFDIDVMDRYISKEVFGEEEEDDT